MNAFLALIVLAVFLAAAGIAVALHFLIKADKKNSLPGEKFSYMALFKSLFEIERKEASPYNIRDVFKASGWKYWLLAFIFLAFLFVDFNVFASDSVHEEDVQTVERNRCESNHCIHNCGIPFLFHGFNPVPHIENTTNKPQSNASNNGVHEKHKLVAYPMPNLRVFEGQHRWSSNKNTDNPYQCLYKVVFHSEFPKPLHCEKFSNLAQRSFNYSPDILQLSE